MANLYAKLIVKKLPRVVELIGKKNDVYSFKNPGGGQQKNTALS
jgi:hypothetical protein